MLAFPTEVEAGKRGDLSTYFGVRFLSEAAAMAQAVAVGWTVFALSNSPLALGLVGLAQFAPQALLTLPAGEMLDRYSPQRVWAAALAAQAVCAAIFAALLTSASPALGPVFAVLALSGAARAFVEPAGQALPARLAPPERLPGVLAGSSAAWQVAVITGPALGGAAYVLGPRAAFGLCAAGFLLAAWGAAMLGGERIAAPGLKSSGDRLARIREGVSFVRSQPIVLGALSIDLLVVLFGDASALMPVFARDILHAGPLGLGLLRSAPAVGACLIALIQARSPPARRVGWRLFAAVATYGGAILVFALSRSLLISLAALALAGASDMVSVNIRSSLVQLATPAALRGRVVAVNVLFVGASSELGGFESGLVASCLGTAPAVAFGGFAALAVAAISFAAFPALRRADRFERIAS